MWKDNKLIVVNFSFCLDMDQLGQHSIHWHLCYWLSNDLLITTCIVWLCSQKSYYILLKDTFAQRVLKSDLWLFDCWDHCATAPADIKCQFLPAWTLNADMIDSCSLLNVLYYSPACFEDWFFLEIEFVSADDELIVFFIAWRHWNFFKDMYTCCMYEYNE